MFDHPIFFPTAFLFVFSVIWLLVRKCLSKIDLSISVRHEHVVVQQEPQQEESTLEQAEKAFRIPPRQILSWRERRARARAYEMKPSEPAENLPAKME